MNSGAPRILQLAYRIDSCHYYELLRALPYPVFLDSNCSPDNGARAYREGRFDILAAAPVAVLQSRQYTQQTPCSPAQGVTRTELQCFPEAVQISVPSSEPDKALEIAETLLLEHTSENNRASSDQQACDLQTSAKLPFISGLIALFGYGFGESLHGIENNAVNDKSNYEWPDIHIGVYQWALIQDHCKKSCTLVADDKLPDQQWIELCALLTTPPATSRKTSPNPGQFQLKSSWSENINYEEYQGIFSALQSYIQNGDSYQVNLARRFSSFYSGDPWQAYKQLRRSAPTPYAAFLELPSACMASLSPERFITVEDGLARTEPIKGTVRRGIDDREDRLLHAQLKASIKDQAENLMIVDLMRNDLGQSCIPGSIEVPALFDIRTYANVHHMVSTVQGQLNNDQGPLQLLRKALPGGSVTGAPKKRSMQIISEMEPHGRSIYCGSLVYLDRRGNMDSNILIRSLLFESGNVYCWGGGAIVADSEVGLEFDEGEQKIRNLLHALSEMH